MSAAIGENDVANGADRRREIRARRHNGLDGVEVDENRRQLSLMFLGPVPQPLAPANVRIDGPPGQPAVSVNEVKRVASPDPLIRDHLQATLSAPGGEGSYRVRMVEAHPDGRPGTAPLRGLDPLFTACTIRFDIHVPAPITVAGTRAGPAKPAAARSPSYMARDYQGLRQLMFDRLAQTMPDWSERHVPDVLVTLVELFAFVGDDLSYYQDAVVTEAYLETARRRTSIRRHAQLVGYRFHDGCHSRAWLDVQVGHDTELALHDVSFTADTRTRTVTFSPLRAMLPPAYATDETQSPPPAPGGSVSLRQAHNEIEIWSWGAHSTSLPAGSTKATLAEPLDTSTGSGERSLRLQPGDVLLFEELHDAEGGPPDTSHRHVVRLTSVERARDPLFDDRAVLAVGWDPLDALPFDLPVNDGPPYLSVARANLVLVGQGSPVSEPLAIGKVALEETDLTWSSPYPDLRRVAVHQSVVLRDLYRTWRLRLARWLWSAERGRPLTGEQRDALSGQLGEDIVTELGLVAGTARSDDEQALVDAIGLWVLLAQADDLLSSRRRRLNVLSRLAASSGPLSGPLLAEVRDDWGVDITHDLDAHHPAAWGPAVDATSQDPRTARPLLTLTGSPEDDAKDVTRWEVTTAVVDAEPVIPRVKVEMDDDGTAKLRFNPATMPCSELTAHYLVGNGTAGNVAAETITRVTPADENITSTRNPLPAVGGTDPEPMDQARRAIPGCYLADQPRALTAADYVAIAARVPGVRRAAAVVDWNGNRLRVRAAVQPVLGTEPDRSVLHRVEQALVVARRIGHDLAVTSPDYYAVAFKVTVRIEAFAIRDDVRHDVSALLGGGLLEDGAPAFFHPSQFGFGDSLYQSALVAAVQELPGVESVTVDGLRFLNPPLRLKPPDGATLAVPQTGIVRCDNDLTSPQHGVVTVELEGGR
jgi:predicted phage baseplate assembly protein